jgi:hypothetical protein
MSLQASKHNRKDNCNKPRKKSSFNLLSL